MRIIMLLPIILLSGLVVFNMDSLQNTEIINFYGIVNYEIPLFLYLSVFVVAYTILIILIFDIIGGLANRKIRKLDKEVFELKSKLYDEREDELVVFLTEQKQRIENFINEQKQTVGNFTEEQKQVIEKLKNDNQLALTEQKADTDRILEKFGLLENGLLDKIKKSFKGKN